MSVEVHRRAYDAVITRLKDTGNSSYQLQVIDLSWKGLDDYDAIQLADCFTISSPVRRLRLHSNEIGNNGTIAIAKLLQRKQEKSNLRYLILSDNKIGLEGAIEIGNGLSNNSSLRHLDLSGNCLKDAGASYILNATINNTSLVSLDLSSNEITDDCAANIASLLRSNQRLRCLRMSDNLLSDAGAKAIFDALKDNTKIQELEIEGINISSNICESIRRLCKTKRKLITRR